MQRVAIAELQPMRHRVTACAVLLLAACTHVRRVPEDPQDFMPRPVVRVESWQARADGRDLGFVELHEIRDPSGPIRFYRVLNRGRQWVGHVAVDGRFYRRVPFREEEEDLGLYPMTRGLAVLYQVEPPVELIVVEETLSEASVPRVDRE